MYLYCGLSYYRQERSIFTLEDLGGNGGYQYFHLDRRTMRPENRPRAHFKIIYQILSPVPAVDHGHN